MEDNVLDIKSKALHVEVSSQAPRVRKIRELIEYGADINYQDAKDGYSILMLAVDSDNYRIVEYLLTLGANPLLENFNGEMASALTSTNSPMYFLLKNYELLTATINNDLGRAKLALESGALIDFQDSRGTTPLLIAVDQNLVEMTNFLLLRGADKTIEQFDGFGIYDLVKDENIYSLLECGRIPEEEEEVKTEKVFAYPELMALIDTPNDNENLVASNNSTAFFSSDDESEVSCNIENKKLLDLFDRKEITLDLSRLQFGPSSLINPPPPATNDQIEALEKHYGHKLPESYKEILRKYNACHPAIHEFDMDDETYSINSFFALTEDDDSELSRDIWLAIDGFSDIAGKNTLPFALDRYNTGTYFFKWVNGKTEVWLLAPDEFYGEFEEPEDELKEAYDEFIIEDFDLLLSKMYKLKIIQEVKE